MDIRIIFVLFALLGVVYDIVLDHLATLQREKPIPPQVADVYDKQRYETYLEYTHERNRASYVHESILLSIQVVVLFSPLFKWLDANLGDNPYLVTILTAAVFSLAVLPERIRSSYHRTFAIDEKYDLNRQTKASFFKDFALGEAADFTISSIAMLFLTFVAIHLPLWTKGFSLRISTAVVLALALLAGLVAVAIVAGLAELMLLKLQYKLTPLPEGDLRNKITGLLVGCKKRVRQIYVYDESSKSTEKNAFVLGIPGFRIIGISDTFLEGNSERELLAVVSHEVGHLKHKRSVLDLTGLAFPLVMLTAFVVLITKPAPVFALADFVRSSFGITHNNYYELLSAIMLFVQPVFFANSLISNYRSRIEEYEADQEAVRNGYGLELADSLKRACADELVNINPHPLIEFIEYDHPDLANRVRMLCG